MYLLLCIFLSYLNHEIREKSFIKLLIFSSIIFLIIGTYGWVNGGESDAWGKSYVYFAYNYLPSTRNEDIFVFFLGFISSLYFLFSYKFNFIIIIINQINLQALILSFSRGYYLLILINLITYLIYIAIYKKKINSIFKYLLLTFLIQIFIFQIINKSVEINLNSVFITKIQSFNYLSESNGESSLKRKNYTHLLKSNRNSLKSKLDEWENVYKKIITQKENKKVKNFKYYESSLLYFIMNFNLFLFFLLSTFFLKFFKN